MTVVFPEELSQFFDKFIAAFQENLRKWYKMKTILLDKAQQSNFFFFFK